MVKMEMRSRSKFVDKALGALGVDAAIIQTTKVDASRLQGCRVKKYKLHMEWTAKTATEGPIIFGFSEGLTTTQLANMFAADPQHDADPGELEESLRHALWVGTISKASIASPIAGQNMSMRPMSGKWPGWEAIEGETVDLWWINVDSASLTSGTLCSGFLELLGDWIDK